MRLREELVSAALPADESLPELHDALTDLAANLAEAPRKDGAA